MDTFGIKPRKTFEEVLLNSDDQVIVRKLLMELVPEEIKEEIIRRFNEHALAYNKLVVIQHGIEALRPECISNI